MITVSEDKKRVSLISLPLSNVRNALHTLLRIEYLLMISNHKVSFFQDKRQSKQARLANWVCFAGCGYGVFLLVWAACLFQFIEKYPCIGDIF